MTKSKDFLAGLGAEPEKGGKRPKAKRSPKRPVISKGSSKPSLLTILINSLTNNTPQILVAGGLTALIAVAGVNAVFLQNGKHPAPFFEVNRKNSDQISRRTTAAIPRPREIVLDRVVPEVKSDPVVLEIQRQLAVRGYYNAEIDGLLGARTRAAIGLYQRAFGEVITNQASRPLLEHIQLSQPDRVFHAAARQRVADNVKRLQNEAAEKKIVKVSVDVIEDPKRIKEIQRALSRLGFKLDEDGVVGRNTRQAVIEFKKQRGLRPDGSITLALFNELIKLKQL